MVLIISSTKGNNLTLANALASICKEIDLDHSVISLEDYNLPLYTPTEEKESGVPKEAHDLAKIFKEAKGFIFCAPEYNGTLPPILNNAVAWISRTDESDWRSCFNSKFSLLSTHSGGGGQKVLNALRTHLEHLGVVVLPRVILTTYSSELKKESAKAMIEQLKAYLS
jgi:chromate reductase, NAD(P)H dehydrogenase (quinone)